MTRPKDVFLLQNVRVLDAKNRVFQVRDLFFAAFHGINHLYYFAFLQKNDIKKPLHQTEYLNKEEGLCI